MANCLENVIGQAQESNKDRNTYTVFAMVPASVKFSTKPHSSSGSRPKFSSVNICFTGSGNAFNCVSCVSSPCFTKVPRVPRTMYRIWGERTERMWARRMTVRGGAWGLGDG